MKECCKTGDQQSPSKFSKWFGRITWGVVILLVACLAIIQMFNL